MGNNLIVIVSKQWFALPFTVPSKTRRRNLRDDTTKELKQLKIPRGNKLFARSTIGLTD
jgi:hypothetical protein